MTVRTCLRATLSALLLVSAPTLAAAAKVYPDPTAATDAFVTAARSGDVKAVLAVLGDRSKAFLVSGDPVSDRAALARSVELYDHSHELSSPDEATRTLAIGDDAWPFSIPVVKGKTGWSFDTAAGEKEILARRVGQNELDVIQVCIGYVEAQRDYLTRNPDGASVPHYADRLLSSPGKRDGLYWQSGPGEPESPMGPAVSGAIGQGYTLKRGANAPYHGYHFRLLTARDRTQRRRPRLPRRRQAHPWLRAGRLAGVLRQDGGDELPRQPVRRGAGEGPRQEDDPHRLGSEALRSGLGLETGPAPLGTGRLTRGPSGGSAPSPDGRVVRRRPRSSPSRRRSDAVRPAIRRACARRRRSVRAATRSRRGAAGGAPR